MLGKLIAIIHTIIAIIISFYGLIVSKNFLYDFLYISLLVLTQILWLIFNHECILSYMYKRYHNKNYSCGYTTTLDDFKQLNMNPLDISHYTGVIFCIAYVFSISIVAFRGNIANPYLILFVCVFLRFFYLFFNDASGYDTNRIGNYLFGKNYAILETIYYNLRLNKLHSEINTVIFSILIAFWIHILYKNRAKLADSLPKKKVDDSTLENHKKTV